MKINKNKLLWNLGYYPLKEAPPKKFLHLMKDLIRERPSRKTESEIEKIMWECGLTNSLGEYAEHLNTTVDGKRVKTYWNIPRGLDFQMYQEKVRKFADVLKAQVIIEPINGCLMIEVIQGVLPNLVPWKFNYSDYPNMVLPFPVGVDQSGLVVWDLYKLPHLLYAGTTGQGKSIFATGLVMGFVPNDMVKLCIIDLGMVDMAFAKDHCLFAGTIYEACALVDFLEQLMHERLHLLQQHKVVNVFRFNKRFPEKKIPYYVLIFEEFAFASPRMALVKEEIQLRKELFTRIMGLALLARKTGVHMCIGLQKPEKEVIPSAVKNQFSGRICLRLEDIPASQIMIYSNDAFYLPSIPGRAIVKLGNHQRQVQIMYYDPDKAEDEIDKYPIRGDEVYERYQQSGFWLPPN